MRLFIIFLISTSFVWIGELLRDLSLLRWPLYLFCLLWIFSAWGPLFHHYWRKAKCICLLIWRLLDNPIIKCIHVLLLVQKLSLASPGRQGLIFIIVWRIIFILTWGCVRLQFLFFLRRIIHIEVGWRVPGSEMVFLLLRMAIKCSVLKLCCMSLVNQVFPLSIGNRKDLAHWTFQG